MDSSHSSKTLVAYPMHIDVCHTVGQRQHYGQRLPPRRGLVLYIHSSAGRGRRHKTRVYGHLQSYICNPHVSSRSCLMSLSSGPSDPASVYTMQLSRNVSEGEYGTSMPCPDYLLPPADISVFLNIYVGFSSLTTI